MIMEREREKNSTFVTILVVVVFLSVVAIFAVPKFSTAERVEIPGDIEDIEECYVPSLYDLGEQEIEDIADYAENWLEETNQ